MTKQEQFFYEHGGYGYRVDLGETPAQGKQRMAEELAKAESFLIASGWMAQWIDDGQDHIGFKPKPETCEQCVLRNDNGVILASLACIDDADDNYRRVVEAELALEAMATFHNEDLEFLEGE